MIVQIISPSKRPHAVGESLPRLVRTAAYCRVSSDSAEQETSYEAQCAHYRSYIAANPAWTLAGIFADEGVTGTQAKKRLAFLRMIDECRAGNIDLVITKSISRFARNTLDCLNYIRELKTLGIPIIFEKESINTMDSSGEVLITILASIAQQESASISANVRMGIEYRFQEGHGRLKYSTFLGYTSNGTPGSYAIVPHEADVVRRIYREYLDGYGFNRIAKRLEAQGVPAPAGGRTWYSSTVRNILTNEKYCGDLLMQKWYTVDYLTHRAVRNDGTRPQYFVEDDHDPIVPKAVFYQVQVMMQQRSSTSCGPGGVRVGERRALCGRLVCGVCGRPLRRHARSDGRPTTWRCQHCEAARRTDAALGGADAVSGGAGGAVRSCRIVAEKDVQAALTRAFCELPREREELLGQLVRLRAEELAPTDALLRACAEEQCALERQAHGPHGTARVADAAKPAEDLAARVRALQRQKVELYRERGIHASKELAIRNVLELVDGAGAAGACGACVGPVDGACAEPDDFFCRTRPPAPVDALDASGRVTSLCDDLVIRHVDKVEVHASGYRVCFKAGVSIVVRR